MDFAAPVMLVIVIGKEGDYLTGELLVQNEQLLDAPEKPQEDQEMVDPEDGHRATEDLEKIDYLENTRGC